jgi:hypothetical protein
MGYRYRQDKYPYLTEDDHTLLALYRNVSLNFIRIPPGLDLWRYQDEYIRNQVERLRRLVADLTRGNFVDLVPIQAMVMLQAELKLRDVVALRTA